MKALFREKAHVLSGFIMFYPLLVYKVVVLFALRFFPLPCLVDTWSWARPQSTRVNLVSEIA